MQQPNWWSQTPRQIQLFTYVLVPVGITLFALGLVLDYTGWWDGHEFLLNVVSSLTGLCFGGPTAVLLFNHLAHTQNEARQNAQTRQRAAEEVAVFEQALLSPFTSPTLADLTVDATELLDKANAIHLLRPDDARDQAVADFMDSLRTLLVPASGRPLTTLRSLSRFSDELAMAKRWRAQIVNSWSTLHDQVRRGLPTGDWIATGPDSAGHIAVDQLLKPGRNPWLIRQGDGHADMRYFLQDLTGLCEAATALKTAFQ
ncbi:hypothetical protein OG885_00850 [Streptomyces sp. NBC_00028]|uniref:hypothetical protein n=1 Tax=Streptomyces sp. NBC_00028 TaxID=2975624 RepID=UPI00324F7FFD